MNPKPYNSDKSDIDDTNVLFNNLPQVKDSFDSNYATEYVPKSTTIQEFNEDIWEARNSEMPFMYGSYNIFEANKADQ